MHCAFDAQTMLAHVSRAAAVVAEVVAPADDKGVDWPTAVLALDSARLTADVVISTAY